MTPSRPLGLLLYALGSSAILSTGVAAHAQAQSTSPSPTSPSPTSPSSACEVEVPDTYSHIVTVPLGGHEDDLMFVAQGGMSLRPSASPTQASVRVRSALAFDAGIAGAPALFALGERVRALDGIVDLQTTATIRQLRTSQRGLLAQVVLSGRDIFFEVPLPCSSLVHIGNRPEEDPDAFESISYDGSAWAPRGEILMLHSTAGGGEFLELESAALTSLVLQGIEQQGPWVRIAWEEEGLRLVGWTRRSQLFDRTGGGFGLMFFRTASTCGGLRTREARAPLRPGVYRGPAELRPGTQVWSARDGVVWAMVLEGEGFEVILEHGSGWAQVVSAPGIITSFGRDIDYAWVSEAEVALPAGVSFGVSR